MRQIKTGSQHDNAGGNNRGLATDN